jgi:hypothetical protein
MLSFVSILADLRNLTKHRMGSLTQDIGIERVAPPLQPPQVASSVAVRQSGGCDDADVDIWYLLAGHRAGGTYNHFRSIVVSSIHRP